MSHIAICIDDPTVDSAALRATHRDAHFTYIESILDWVLIAGPAGGAADADYGLSVFIYATDDRAAAEQLLHGDPYFRCGLYGETRLERFTPAAGRWIGGTVW